MSYKTYFKLSTVPYDAREDAIDNLGIIDESYFEEDWGWYNHDDNMMAVSKKIPNVLFILQGEGEDPGDVWRKIYHNGEIVDEWFQPEFVDPPIPQEILGLVDEKAYKASITERLQHAIAIEKEMDQSLLIEERSAAERERRRKAAIAKMSEEDKELFGFK